MTNCFAYMDEGVRPMCMCLDKLYCKGDFAICPFYKTNKEYVEGLKKYPKKFSTMKGVVA